MSDERIARYFLMTNFIKAMAYAATATVSYVLPLYIHNVSVLVAHIGALLLAWCSGAFFAFWIADVAWTQAKDFD